MLSTLRNHPPTLTGGCRPVEADSGEGPRGQISIMIPFARPMVTGRQPPVKGTCFAAGYPLLFQIFWLRDSQGQIDGLLTQKMLNLLLQFGKLKHLC